MIVTVVDKNNDIIVTIDKPKVIEVKRKGAAGKYEIMLDGVLVTATEDKYNAIELFKSLSTKIETESHYYITTDNYGKISIVPYSADKF